MKFLVAFIITVLGSFVGETYAQKKVPLGTLSGTITIKELSGNNLGGFGCSNINVHLASLIRTGPPYTWSMKAPASGDVRSGRCRYSIPNVRSGSDFTVGLTASFPRSCDLKVFKADSSFPLKLSPKRVLVYSPAVQQVTCTIVK